MFTILSLANGAVGESGDFSIVADFLKAGTLFWLNLDAPTPDEFKQLGETFQFHPLAMEDAQRPHQRPKVDEYEGYFFLAADEAHYTPSDVSNDSSLQSRQIGMFMGPNYLITIDTAQSTVIAAMRDRCKRHSQLLEHGVDRLLYNVLDAVVDGYFPILDIFDDLMDSLEDTVMSGTEPGVLEKIFAIKKSLTRLRRMSGPLREVLQTLTTRNFPHIEDATIPYLRDVSDHLFRIYETLDGYRDLMSNMLDAYLTQLNNHMSRIMQRLTAVATVFMPITFLTGVFGMNFAKQPWADTNVWIWISGMAATGTIMLSWFKLKRWF